MATIQAEVRELIDAVRANGYQVEMPQGGQAEAKVFYRGEPAMSDTGVPLTIHTTPSDHRWYKNEVARLRRAGVLQEDPKKVGQRAQTSGRPDPRDPAIAEARRKGIADAARERQAKTRALRGRMEHVLKPLGVWKIAGRGHSGWRGTVAEVARVAYFWGESQNYEGLFPSEGAAKTSMKNLYDGTTIKEPAQKFWGDFLDELETSADPRERYFELLRTMTVAMPPQRGKPDDRLELAVGSPNGSEGSGEQVSPRRSTRAPEVDLGDLDAGQRRLRGEIEALREPAEQALVELKERKKALTLALTETDRLLEEAEGIVAAFKARKESDRRRPRPKKVGPGSRPDRAPRMKKAERIEIVSRLLSENGALSQREMRERLGWPEGTTRNVIVWMDADNMLQRSGDPNRPSYSLRA